MKITEGQLIVLMQTTVESLRLGNARGVFTYDEQTRRQVSEAVFHQQTDTLIAKPHHPIDECDCPPVLGSDPHSFEPTKHDISCAKCGGGRLHPIHVQ